MQGGKRSEARARTFGHGIMTGINHTFLKCTVACRNIVKIWKKKLKQQIIAFRQKYFGDSGGHECVSPGSGMARTSHMGLVRPIVDTDECGSRPKVSLNFARQNVTKNRIG